MVGLELAMRVLKTKPAVWFNLAIEIPIERSPLCGRAIG
jgi:hypothetical protein